MDWLPAGIATNTVPALWMAQVSTRYQEVFTLTLWYMVSHTAALFKHMSCSLIGCVSWACSGYALVILQDILKRYDQLNNWTAGSITTPNSVWLPGLFNPKVCKLASHIQGQPAWCVLLWISKCRCDKLGQQADTTLLLCRLS